jgi:hypothetical protein
LYAVRELMELQRTIVTGQPGGTYDEWVIEPVLCAIELLDQLHDGPRLRPC